MRYNALIAEGTAEQVILTQLLNAEYLIFTKQTLLEHRVLRTRNGQIFAKKYLTHRFEEPVQVYRVLDSRNERFRLPKPYEIKVVMHEIYTTPEIEMLLICSEGLLNDYKHIQNVKPSIFISQRFKANIKSRDFNDNYWTPNKIVAAVKIYEQSRRKNKGEQSIYSLINSTALKWIYAGLRPVVNDMFNGHKV